MEKDITVGQALGAMADEDHHRSPGQDVEGQNLVEHDIDKIEKVYNKLDWRIIPGMLLLPISDLA